MTIVYLKNVKTKEELRKAYLRLMKENHPDAGGDTEVCKVINAEYDYLVTILPERAADNGKHESKAQKASDIKMDEMLRETINSIIHMTGINIEIIGTWIWVDGNTYPWRFELHKYGFIWSKPRRKWHYTPYGGGFHRKGKKSFDSIRALYGSTIVKDESPEYILG